MIAKIAVAAANFAIDKPYSYLVPEGMALASGMRVTVPFGRSNRRTEGIVLSVEDGADEHLKAVEQALDEAAVLSETLLRLAAFVRERYFCTFYEAARAMLPAGLWFRRSDTVRLTEDCAWRGAELRQSDAKAVLAYLSGAGGAAPLAELKQAVPDEAALQKALRYLTKKKWIVSETAFSRTVGDKTERIATLAASAEETMEYAAHLPKTASMQRAVLETLCRVGSVSVKELCYFTGAKSATVSRLAEKGYVRLEERARLRCAEIRPAKDAMPLTLNAEQRAAFDGLFAQLTQPQPGVALLYGVTGSGKTAVYIRLIREVLSQGRQAMYLVPEIALTPQLLGLLAAYFGDKIAVLHSSLSASERYDQWKRVRSGAASVVVGTRSAVFAPCPRLGLIVLDEEQEHSYKSENSPRYAAQEIAVWRGAKENALVLFGSATPSVECMYRAKTGVYTLYTLARRFNGRALPAAEIVDMREELKAGNDSVLSLPLQAAIRETADAGKQTILFLNRRGNSRALVCVECGEAPECPKCSAKLTYHSANERLMCHYCGYSQPAETRCPRCGGALKRIGTGTQKVQQELAALFPELEVDRMDADTVSALNTHEKILAHFQSEHVPILVGTQMVAKGLNLPEVTLVGVLDADLSLYTDSFRAAQTTFNMLTQVAGRAGRGSSAGRAILQTMQPEHRVIALAAQQDYDGFYELELSLRRVQKLPPFGDSVEITFSGLDEAAVLRAAVKFRDSLRENLPEERAAVLGPAPCSVPKINYHFRYRLTLRCRMDKALRRLLAFLLRSAALDRANRGVNVFADVNGFD